MLGAIASGFPVAFALPGAAIITIGMAAFSGFLFTGSVDAFFVHGGPSIWLSTGVTNSRGIYWVIEQDILIAIPLFVLMGLMLQRSKIAEDLLMAMARLMRPVPGGMAVSVIFVGTLLAATTGIVGATVVSMGMISLPVMLKNGYSKSLATGTIAASGTLGQIIPPSIILLILVDQLTAAVSKANADRRALYKISNGELSMPSEFDVLSVSAGDLFMGAVFPGLTIVMLYMLFVFGLALFRPGLAPKSFDKGKYDWTLLVRVFSALVPPLTLILLVLGSIITGVATVNQAGAIGAGGAIIMAGYRLHRGKSGAYRPAALALLAMLAIGLLLEFFDINLRKINTSKDVIVAVLAAVSMGVLIFSLCWSGWRTLKTDRILESVVLETAKTTSMIFAILLGAAMLTAAFRAFGGEILVKDFLQSMPGGFWGQFTFVMLIMFILGFYLDFVEITVVVVPIVAPILLTDPSANVTAVWLGVMMCMIMQTSFLTPPFGFALFYLRGVAPKGVRTTDIYKGVIPFIGLQLLALVIVGAYPSLVNYLPSRVSFFSKTAPPPTNPRLQSCIEQFVFKQLDKRSASIRQAINKARALDLQTLPEQMRDDLRQSFDRAEQVFALMKAAREAERAVSDEAPSHRPLLNDVRIIERNARRIDKKIAEQKVIVSRVGGVVSKNTGQNALARIESLTAQRNLVLGGIPDNWTAENNRISSKLKDSDRAIRRYRRTVDDAYEPLAEAIATITAVKLLKNLKNDLHALPSLIDTTQSAGASVSRITSIHSSLSGIRGVGSVRRELRAARKILRKKQPDLDLARASLESAVAQFETEIRWRSRASRELLPGLKTYDTIIADTIGVRGQSRLPDHIALEIAGCSAKFRDIYLNF